MKSEQFERELRFIAYYLHKGSHTYSNGRRSALKAGYRDSYAQDTFLPRLAKNER